MSTVDIRKALNTAANDFLTANASIDTVGEGTISGLPTLAAASIGWENRNFDPAGKEPWAAVFFVPNAPQMRTIGPRGYDQETGFLQIDFNVAPGKGAKTLSDWEYKARLYFHPGRFFTYSGQSLIVTSTGMSAGRHVENYFRKSLTVAFRSHIKRNEVT